MSLPKVVSILILLSVLLMGCSQAEDEALAGTVAALAAQNNALATQNAALAEQVADVVEQVVTPTVATTATATVSPTAVSTEVVAPTVVSPTVVATATAVPTHTRPPATQPPPAATAVPQPLLVDWYLRDITDLEDGGKRVTFVWRVDNMQPQHEVRIFAGTQQRFQPWWVVASSGEMTVDLGRTIYPDPWATLNVYDTVTLADLGSWQVRIPWSCPIPYFFDFPEGWFYPCASDEPQRGVAAEQFFENGRMLWIESLDTIFVFYTDGQYPQWQSFTDLWEPGDPETDPTITPPENRYQPVRGFNKVWLERDGVRVRLGWGVAPEEVFTVTYQIPEYESAVGAATIYIQMIDGQVRQLASFDIGSGSWDRVVRP